MNQFMEFWPEAAVLGYVPDNSVAGIYTKSFPTHDFSEVVVQVSCTVPIAFDALSCIQVLVQSSNSHQEWEYVPGGTFNGIFMASPYPFKEVRKVTEFGAFMRVAIAHISFSGVGLPYVGGTIRVTGIGRCEDDEDTISF